MIRYLSLLAKEKWIFSQKTPLQIKSTVNWIALGKVLIISSQILLTSFLVKVAAKSVKPLANLNNRIYQSMRVVCMNVNFVKKNF